MLVGTSSHGVDQRHAEDVLTPGSGLIERRRYHLVREYTR